MPDCLVQRFDNPQDLDAAAWDALLERQAEPTPFMRHAYLLALHESGSATPATGWSPQFVLVYKGSELVAAAAQYLKTHSWGEYVFDWAWADAYRRHGLAYYPKAVIAAPFAPVSGSRLLARDELTRQQLVQALIQGFESQELSSGHILFMDAAERQALATPQWLLREGVQFHWQADAARPCPDFASFLGQLTRHRRKNIQQEMRRVAEAGVHFECLEGPAIDAAAWDYFYRCHTLTYQAHGGKPYLSRDFFSRMAHNMPEHWVMFTAWRGSERVAVSLMAVDSRRGLAWGRYWGCTESIACLHFSACYYEPLAWCLARGYRRFEGGAQGEHKMARGLMPVKTYSAHWLRDPRFAQAVADFLAREGEGINAYVDELREHSPFKGV